MHMSYAPAAMPTGSQLTITRDTASTYEQMVEGISVNHAACARLRLAMAGYGRQWLWKAASRATPPAPALER